MRMEETHLSNDAGQNRHPKRAEDRSADIHAHYAVTFRRVQTEALRNNGDVGFSVNGVARADRFAFHADEERHRQTKDQRAEEVAEFLHDQRPAGLHDHFNIRTDIERDLRDQQKNATESILPARFISSSLTTLQRGKLTNAPNTSA